MTYKHYFDASDSVKDEMYSDGKLMVKLYKLNIVTAKLA